MADTPKYPHLPAELQEIELDFRRSFWSRRLNKLWHCDSCNVRRLPDESDPRGGCECGFEHFSVAYKMLPRLLALADEAGKIAEVANAHGWNGTDNSKILYVFLEDALSGAERLRGENTSLHKNVTSAREHADIQVREIERLNSRVAEWQQADEKSHLFCSELVMRCADGLRAGNALEAANIRIAVLETSLAAAESRVKELEGATKLARTALEHESPDGCFSSGPTDKADLENLMAAGELVQECIGCRAIAAIDKALAAQPKEEKR